MKLPKRSTSVYILGFVVFLIVFAYVELTYTRRVDGTSMLPTLEQGDLVVIQSVPFSDLKVGDIIVYSPPCSATGESVIHRIVNVSGDGVITRGDNNGYTDPAGGISRGPVTASCYVGQVVFIVPYIERIASLPYGANYIIAALIFIAIIYLWLAEQPEPKAPKSEEAPSVGVEPQATLAINAPVLFGSGEMFPLV